MAQLYLKTPPEVMRELGQRAKELRLRRNLTQVQLGERADISPRSLARFENTGHGTVGLMVKTALALGAGEALGKLFVQPRVETMAQRKARRQTKARQRARGSK